MSTAIADFAAKQDAHNAAIDASIAGISGDISTLNDEIKTLQASATISAEDQAILARLDAASQSAQDKLAALDALTPPEVPAEPATPPPAA